MTKVLLYSYYDTTAGWVAHLNPKPSTLNGLRVEGAPREAKRPPVASTSRHRSLTFQRLSQMDEGCVGFRVQDLGFRVLRCRESSNGLMFGCLNSRGCRSRALPVLRDVDFPIYYPNKHHFGLGQASVFSPPKKVMLNTTHPKPLTLTLNNAKY